MAAESHATNLPRKSESSSFLDRNLDIKTKIKQHLDAAEAQKMVQMAQQVKEHHEVSTVLWQIVQDAFTRITHLVCDDPFVLMLPLSGGGAVNNIRDSCLDVLIRELLSEMWGPCGLVVEIGTTPWAGILWGNVDKVSTSHFVDSLSRWRFTNAKGVIFYPLLMEMWKNTEARAKRERHFLADEAGVKEALGPHDPKLLKRHKSKAGEIFEEVSQQVLGSSTF
jgi:hypothetical protein